MFQHKKDVNKKSKVFLRHSLCLYYQFLWGKCKELQRKDWVDQVFCLGAVIAVGITQNSPTNNILQKRDLMVRQECPREFM